METKKRIGILTGGGDCPGLNAAIRAVTKSAIQRGYDVIGIQNGWKGLLDNETMTLDRINTSGIIDRGGTILGISRVSPFAIENGPQQVFDRFNRLNLKALVVLGGEGTLSVSSKLYKMGLPVIGIPKTIDNDVAGTDFTIGFQTAVQIATDALDRLRSTAESHHRVMLLEVMGRYAGWIATYAGMANGADAILIPEIPLNEARIEEFCQMLTNRKERGVNFSIVVVAEGTVLEGKIVALPEPDNSRAEDSTRLGGIANVLEKIIQQRTNLETRVSSLGYVQRGGTPVAYDRSLATAFGVKATDLVERKIYGVMTSLKGNRITTVPLEAVQDKTKKVNMSIYRVAEYFFG
ncbi:MAG: 6-phosphofructokinase [Chloroflexi bacterium]|nr:6-phosphofructokinase [Chloroflexota bacterium]